LALLKPLEAEGLLDDYYLFHAAKADLLRRAGNFAEAATYYKKALALTQNPVEQNFLQRRLAGVRG
jgi:RNA polymerase sigma-70 factor (ECF subfamily)